MTPQERAQFLDQLIRDLQTETFDLLKSLETRLAEIIRNAPPNTNLRFTVQQLFEQYKGLIAQSLAALSTVDELAVTDQTYTDLRLAASDQITAGVDTMAAEVLALITISSAAGTAITDLVRQVRGRISGIYMTSADPVVIRNQRLLGRLFEGTGANADEIAAATEVIRNRLRGVNTTLSLRDLTSRATEQAVMEFDGAWTYHQARQQGVKRWRYEGGLIESSREFCTSHQGKIYTEAEIREIWNSSSWGGKKPGNPFVVRGGYRCRHFWEPIQEDK